MKVKVFSIYDSAAQAYNQPFFLQAKGQALRIFADSVNDKTSNLFKHPQDYTLFELGEFDDSCAGFALHKTPLSLGVAIEFKAVFPQVPSPSVVPFSLSEVKHEAESGLLDRHSS